MGGYSVSPQLLRQADGMFNHEGGIGTTDTDIFFVVDVLHLGQGSPEQFSF